MFAVEQGTAVSMLEEMAQNEYDLISITMLLTAVTQNKEVLVQQYTPQLYDLLLTQLFEIFESNTRELTFLAACVRRQLESVGDTL